MVRVIILNPPVSFILSSLCLTSGEDGLGTSVPLEPFTTPLLRFRSDSPLVRSEVSPSLGRPRIDVRYRNVVNLRG